MTKKRHEAIDETKKGETGDVADNVDINSNDDIARPEELKISNEPYNSLDNSIAKEAMAQEQYGSTAKETLKDESAEVKLAELQDRYLRLSAEFDNYRKRTLREKIELTKHAGENILKSIVPVMDDFERALNSLDSSDDFVAMKAGIDLIYNKFRDFLTQNGLKEIESLHCQFNVDLHEAVTKIPVEDENLKGRVVEVLQKGYYLHDKVLRFAKVVVGE
ncbi:MAG: nucleotide exchange factor GrpE [Bacteroidales bacterium]|jgi:molecular chaperone GrpE